MKQIIKLITAVVLLLVLQVLPSMGYQKFNTTEIKLSVLPGLQFSLPRFQVKPGQQVNIVFNNTDNMEHNLLIVNPGQREKIVQKAMSMGSNGAKNNYIPNDSDVLCSIPVLRNGESQTLTFKAPDKEGVYPYVCTFPGHGFIMYGAMYVSSSNTMPPIEKDKNVSPSRMKADASHVHH